MADPPISIEAAEVILPPEGSAIQPLGVVDPPIYGLAGVPQRPFVSMVPRQENRFRSLEDVNNSVMLLTFAKRPRPRWANNDFTFEVLRISAPYDETHIGEGMAMEEWRRVVTMNIMHSNTEATDLQYFPTLEITSKAFDHTIPRGSILLFL